MNYYGGHYSKEEIAERLERRRVTIHKGTVLNKARRVERKREMMVRKGNCCEVCGYTSGDVIDFDFHHLDPKLKDNDPAQIMMSRDIALRDAELAKCILVCAFCHRKLHAGEVDLESDLYKFRVA